MGEPNTTTPGTLTTDTLIPIPPYLSHLKRHLSVTNGPRRQKIKEDLANCKQHGRPVEVYYRKLIKIMDTYYRPLHVSQVSDSALSKVASRIPLPSLEEAYNIIRQEEDLQNNSRNQEERQRPRIVQVVTDHVSEDWLLELLERLPEKSLSRFKSVSKQWKTMMESSYLAKKRLARSNTKVFVLRVEMSTDRYSRTIYLEDISKNHHDHSKIIIHTYKFPHPFPTSDVGWIMGILSPELLREYTGLSGWAGTLPVSVGFGRDIVTGAYKVILMYLFAEGDNIVKTEVLNLQSGERQHICFPLTYDELGNDKLSVFANGSLFWLKEFDYRLPSLFAKLGAIDLHTEKFRDVLLPRWYSRYCESVYTIWSLRDRLCISDVLQYPTVEVRCLQQEDPSVKWEKILIIDTSSLDCLDTNYWKLGLAAYNLNRGNEPPNNFLEHVSDEHRRTVLCTENFVFSV
uniref:F-box domain-containing protein n=1 Tax=Brassica oleracea var. oleracea TaxID=109376 RepID=A0A0D3BWA3_BRAOL